MSYQLLDSGDFEKLEKVGPYIIRRPAAQAVWRKTESHWPTADAVYHRYSEGKGEWKTASSVPQSWTIELGDLKLIAKLTSFGHLGLFAEQQKNWSLIQNRIEQTKNNRVPLILNLFAYTGGSSLVAGRAGAEVVHVDASKGSVDWAKRNFEANGIESTTRYMVDDVMAFVEREVRRGRVYDGIILDPPTYGRGPQKEIWKIEEHLLPLLDMCKKLLEQSSGFVLLSCHSQGYTPIALKHLLASSIGAHTVEAEEMVIMDRFGKALPSGASAFITY